MHSVALSLLFFILVLLQLCVANDKIKTWNSKTLQLEEDMNGQNLLEYPKSQSWKDFRSFRKFENKIEKMIKTGSVSGEIIDEQLDKLGSRYKQIYEKYLPFKKNDV